MLVLDGKTVAASLRQDIQGKIQSWTQKGYRPPRLTVVMVGHDKASEVYVRNKHLACQKVGIESVTIHLPENTQQDELDALIAKLNQDDKTDGVLVQLPLPSHLNASRVQELLSANKDADGLTISSAGLLWAGLAKVKPCTPWGVMKILEFYNISPKGLNAVVVGRSQIVGKPMAALLLEAQATVTVCHSQTKNLKQFTQAADLVVVAAGRPLFLGKEDFKKNAVVIDVGMHGSGSGGQLCGDVRYEELKDWVQAATPVPGGVGPMTIACLLENTLKLYEQGIEQKRV